MARNTHDRTPDRAWWLLCAVAGMSWLGYLLITVLRQSLHEERSGQHSLLLILGLFLGCFLAYLLALRLALKARQDGRLITLIWSAAVAFRLTMLFSDPIEEIDLYRYLWDGAATCERVNPFRYAPQQVLAASAEDDLPPDLRRLVELRERSPVFDHILRRVHFGQLPTIYPPVAQAVFALATISTPADASLTVRMEVMKAWMVAFDLATLAAVMVLSRTAGRKLGWSIAYAWCPLVIKEIANSGHVDAVANFFVVAACACAARALYLSKQPSPRSFVALATIGSALALALAIGAKLYPVILIPLFFGSFAWRLGWRQTLSSLLVLGIATTFIFSPALPAESAVGPRAYGRASLTLADPGSPPLPPAPIDSSPRDPRETLRAFLTQWEMNDFLFLVVMENIRPVSSLPPGQVAWFSIVPDSWRAALSSWCGELPVEPHMLPFLLTRALLSTVFIILAAYFAWTGARRATAAGWLEAAFLTVAWFWLLLPTLNPWYWTWALPLAVFARGRAWLAVSGLVFAYYLRFWFSHHYADTTVLGTRYTGTFFFDYVITWIEFAPWFVWLGIAGLMRQTKRYQQS